MDSFRKIGVFFSSPGDLFQEREIFTEICREISLDRGSREGFAVEPVKWETHSRPGIGGDSQEVIFRNLDGRYAIYIGAIGNRFGTETPRAGSGTEDEFDQSIAGRKSGFLIDILFYFRSHKTAPGPIAAKDIARIESFKEKLRSLGIAYWGYETDAEFRQELSRHLSSAITDILGDTKHDAPTDDPTSGTASRPSPSLESETDTVFDPLENLANLGNLDEDGVLELAEIIEESVSHLSVEFKNVTDALEVMALHMNTSTSELKELDGTPKELLRARALPILDRTSKGLEHYVQAAASALPKMTKEVDTILSTTQRTIRMRKSIDVEDKSGDEADSIAIQQLIDTFNYSIEEIENTQQALDQWPSLNKKLNTARRRVVAVNKDMRTFFERSIGQCKALLAELNES